MSQSVSGPDDARNIVGWIAVGLTVLVASLFAMYAGSEALADKHPGLASSLARMLTVMALGLAALRWPGIGGGLLVAAAMASGLQFALVSGVAFLTGAQTYIPVIAAGFLYLFGRPAPRRLAAGLIATVPVIALGSGVLLAAWFRAQITG